MILWSRQVEFLKGKGCVLNRLVLFGHIDLGSAFRTWTDKFFEILWCDTRDRSIDRTLIRVFKLHGNVSRLAS